MASIEELTGKSRDAILADIMDRGRAVTPEQVHRSRADPRNLNGRMRLSRPMSWIRFAPCSIFGPDGAHKVTTAVCEMRALQTQPPGK